MKKHEDKFVTKKNDISIVGKLTEEELETFMETGKLPERIKENTTEDA